MVLDLSGLIKEYDLDIRGIYHIGGFNGGEWTIYQSLGIEAVFFEPVKANYAKLAERVGRERAYLVALGNFDGFATINVASNGQSSCILPPHEHLAQYPTVTFRETETVRVMKLDDILTPITLPLDANMINIDVEGYELEVFRGASEVLKKIDYIMCEVALIELQRGRPLVGDIDDFLKTLGFYRFKTEWTVKGWGDAFYMR